MADESSESENSFLERLINSRNRDLSILFPLILGIMRGGSPRTTTTTTTNDDNNEEDSDSDDREEETDRIILINPFTQGMIVVEGGGGRSLEALLREMLEQSGNKGPPPASKASIDEMPSVEVEEGEECAICLEEMKTGGEEAREMPCKHRYHSDCIEKWLGLHGSCPVCRYKMPVEEEGKKSPPAPAGGGERVAYREGGGGEEEGGMRRRRRREIWVSFSVNRRSDSSSSTERSNTTTTTSSDADQN